MSSTPSPTGSAGAEAPRAHPTNALTAALASPLGIATALLLTFISAYPFLWDDQIAPHSFFDLNVYYGAVAHWLETGDLYNWALPPEEIYGFTYPPLAALVFAPFVVLTDATTAGPIFLCLNIAALVLLAFLSLRGLDVSARLALAAALWLAPLFLTLFPISFNMELGQINLFLVVLILTDVIYLRGTRWHGVLMALAASIKMTPAIFGIYFLAVRDWKSLVRFVGAGLAGIGLSFAVMPQRTLEFFTQKIFESDRVGSITGALNYNLLGSFSMVLPGEVAGVFFALSALAVLALTYLAVRRLSARQQHLGAVSAVATLGLLLSPISWTHHWVWLVTFLLFSAVYGWRSGSKAYLYLAATGTLLFAMPFAVWFGGPTWGTAEWPLPLGLMHALPVVWAVAYLLVPVVQERKPYPARPLTPTR
ncbi:MAG: glycosyltransferase 87 family protein [Rothia sp. (in: high G+C Gram-positive bacteria)]|nr:glycosyltransferase 87 family protein [Rothia sp. (in: high G+C Gram-positive bacteria)]